MRCLPMGQILAIDFETANNAPDSACSVGIAVLRSGAPVETRSWLIKPPAGEFIFTGIHGISAVDVASERSFDLIWPEIEPYWNAATYIAAHNASFDLRVLRALAARNRFDVSAKPVICTLKLSRATWVLESYRLSEVCRHLRIPLKHHDAESDARACAYIVGEALRAGKRLAPADHPQFAC